MAGGAAAATAVDFVLHIYSHQEGTQKDASAQTGTNKQEWVEEESRNCKKQIQAIMINLIFFFANL